MDQKELFDEEEGKIEGASEGDELEDLRGKLNPPKKGKTKLLLVIGLLLVVGAYAANIFLSKQEEPGVPTVPPQRIPIKGAPVMGVVTGVKAVTATTKEVAKKEEAKVRVKAEKKVKEAVKAGAKKAEVKKIEEVKIAKKEEAPKPKPVKPSAKEAVKTEAKKGEAKPAVKRPEEVKVAKKEDIKAKVAIKAETTVIIGTYAARYDLEAAQEMLKGTGIRYLSRETKKKLVMNRVFVKEARDKEEARGLISDLKEKGYEPFSVPANGGYKVYAVSNLSEDIANENKADLESQGYNPAIEKKAVDARVYELVARAKSGADVKALSARLKKMGFRPEMSK
ncbi:MAG: SPOR domain-containing protein [Deltaproteobacteria bacterium]|nr:SPOR domain-containing protein [Deltaproteobacteria bacterium]